jgi:hypothetical protein
MYSKIGYDAEATSHSKNSYRKEAREKERKLLIHGREYYGPFASVSYLCMKREREAPMPIQYCRAQSGTAGRRRRHYSTWRVPPSILISRVSRFMRKRSIS